MEKSLYISYEKSLDNSVIESKINNFIESNYDSEGTYLFYEGIYTSMLIRLENGVKTEELVERHSKFNLLDSVKLIIFNKNSELKIKNRFGKFHSVKIDNDEKNGIKIERKDNYIIMDSYKSNEKKVMNNMLLWGECDNKIQDKKNIDLNLDNGTIFYEERIPFIFNYPVKSRKVGILFDIYSFELNKELKMITKYSGLKEVN